MFKLKKLTPESLWYPAGERFRLYCLSVTMETKESRQVRFGCFCKSCTVCSSASWGFICWSVLENPLHHLEPEMMFRTVRRGRTVPRDTKLTKSEAISLHSCLFSLIYHITSVCICKECWCCVWVHTHYRQMYVYVLLIYCPLLT